MNFIRCTGKMICHRLRDSVRKSGTLTPLRWNKYSNCSRTDDVLKERSPRFRYVSNERNYLLTAQPFLLCLVRKIQFSYQTKIACEYPRRNRENDRNFCGSGTIGLQQYGRSCNV